jgi:hemolysin III
MHVLDFREPVSAWTHFAGLMISVPGVLLLWRRSGRDLGRRISVLIYGLGLILCYTGSTLYHGVQRPYDQLGPFVRLDSVGIFALIAGSYTPVAWNLMRGPWRLWTLTLVWATAITSMILIESGRPFPRVLGTCVYLVMGWGVVVCYAQIARVVSHRALLPLVLGGLSYSVGAVLNITRWPALWPGYFGTHDLFHIFVIVGSLAHYWFILKVALPFRWGPTELVESTPRAGSSESRVGDGPRGSR